MKNPNSTFRTQHDRQKSADERKELREKRTTQQQLKILDDRLGKGMGASKERERLTRLIESSKSANSDKKEKKATKKEKEKDRKKTKKGNKSSTRA